MQRSRIVGVVFLVLSVATGVLVALPPATAAGTIVTVNIPSGAGNPSGAPGFAPDNITVVLGVNATVLWVNNDSAYHTVYTSTIPTGATAYQSAIFKPGQNVTETFTVAGTYDYYCSLHAWMTGSVIVKPATTTTPEFPTYALAAILLAVVGVAALTSRRLVPAPTQTA